MLYSHSHCFVLWHFFPQIQGCYKKFKMGNYCLIQSKKCHFDTHFGCPRPSRVGYFGDTVATSDPLPDPLTVSRTIWMAPYIIWKMCVLYSTTAKLSNKTRKTYALRKKKRLKDCLPHSNIFQLPYWVIIFGGNFNPCKLKASVSPLMCKKDGTGNWICRN